MLLLEIIEVKNVTLNRIDHVTYDVCIHTKSGHQNVKAEFNINFKDDNSIRRMAERIEKRAAKSSTQPTSVHLALDIGNGNKLILLEIENHISPSFEKR